MPRAVRTTTIPVLTRRIFTRSVLSLHNLFRRFTAAASFLSRPPRGRISDLESFVHRAPLPMMLLSRDGATVRIVNEAFRDLFGYSTGDCAETGRWWVHAVPDAIAREAMQCRLSVAGRATGDAPQAAEPMRLTSRCRNGEERSVVCDGMPLDNEMAVWFTEMKGSERLNADLRAINRKLHAISECNQALLRATDEQTLLREICRIACEVAGYRLAWVGLAEQDAASTICPVAWAGEDSGYIAKTHLTWSEASERGRGPTGTAIRTGRTVYIQDVQADPRMEPWRADAAQRGFRSSIAVPLLDEQGTAFGALNIYSVQLNAFTQEEIGLLEELAGDLAFGIRMLRVRAERARAEDALRESEQKYRTLFEDSFDGLFISSPEGRILDVNKKGVALLGYPSKEDVLKLDLERDVYEHALDRKRILATVNRRGTAEFDLPLHRKGGGIFLAHCSLTAMRDADGRVVSYQGIIQDITDQKRSEEALRASEERFAAAFQSSPVPMAIFRSADHRCIDANDGFARLVDCARARVLGCTSDEMGLYADAGTREVLLTALAERGTVTNWEIRVGRGGQRTALTSATTISIRGERHYILLVLDITDRKQAEEALRQLQRATEQSPALIVITDVAGTIQYVNPKFCKVTGYSAAEVVGRNPRLLKSGELSHQDYERLWGTILGGAEWRGEFHNRKKDGTLYWESASISPITDATGAITHFVAVKEDITEKKRTQEALQEQALYIRQLFDGSPVGIVMLDLQSRITSANRAFRDLFHFPFEELQGRNIDELIVPPQYLQEAMGFSRLTCDGEMLVQHETVRWTKERTPVTVMISGYPIVVNGRRVGVYATYTDITERARLQQQLIQAQKMESLGTLAAGIAHDFNNILSIILGHAELIMRRREDETRLGESADSIRTAATRGAALVRQLLTFARKTDVLYESVLVDSVVKDIRRLIDEAFPRTITVRTDIQRDLPPILADLTQIHQVILNLCVNARDAMPEGGTLTLTAHTMDAARMRAKFPAATAAAYIEIGIGDTGTGMDEQTRSRMFEPFFTTKQPGIGTGLGLSIVQGVVASHKGFIDCQSEPGKGTTFTVYFPVEDRMLQMLEKRSAAAEEPPGGTETILVVEDEPALCELLAGILTSKGYRVVTAADGAEGVAVFSTRRAEIQLVITDLGLPKLSGAEVIRQLREIDPRVPIIVASGFIEPDVRTDILRIGAKEFIQKPYAHREILKKIRGVLEGRGGGGN